MVRIKLAQAHIKLRMGGLVAIPTETVYGIAASLDHVSAIKKIFELKRRPPNNPLIVHLPHPLAVESYIADLPPGSQELMAHFWPGPLTLVLPIKIESIPNEARAGLPTAAFRVPSHPLTLQLLHLTGPLVAPSANRSGSPSSTAPSHVEEDFDDLVPVLDGGMCDNGVESTILVSKNGKWHIARFGALTPEVLAEQLGYYPSFLSSQSPPLCPGMMHRHYAPKARLLLGSDPYRGQARAVIGFSDRIYSGRKRFFSLGLSTRPEEVCYNLYEILRYLDRRGILVAWVDMDFPDSGLWRTVRERLERAAQS